MSRTITKTAVATLLGTAADICYRSRCFACDRRSLVDHHSGLGGLMFGPGSQFGGRAGAPSFSLEKGGGRTGSPTRFRRV